MNKALERPLSWHQNRFDTMREQEVKCYLLFREDREDREEHNCYFPYTRLGLVAAQSLAKKLGQSPEQILITKCTLKALLPYGVRFVGEYQKWCKEWGINEI